VRVLRDTFTWLPAWRHNAQDFLRDAREEEIYVAVTDSRIVGFAAYHRPGDFLHSLYVSERGGGAGQALLARVTEESAGGLSLKCQAKNRRAQAFYRREGFRVVERGADPWEGGVVWVRMART
jgi:GNAT superfamily N-acetyltransferase